MSDVAILAAGCFWGIEDKFSSAEGVTRTEVGYIGGNASNPTYQDDVCHRRYILMLKLLEYFLIQKLLLMTQLLDLFFDNT